MQDQFSRPRPPKRIHCPHCHKQFAYPRSPWVALYEHVDLNGPIPMHRPWLGPCEVWRGRINKKHGRGVVHLNGVQWYVPRLAYQLHFGPIAPGLVVCHDCDNPLCVRADHLFLGRPRHNHADMVAKGRQATEHLKGWRNPRSAGRVLAVAIRAAWAEGGVTRAELARMFGLSHKTVTSIVSGVRYRNL
jgi:DNA-binding XRE family transcriptional regulator